MVRLAVEHGATLFHASALGFANEISEFQQRQENLGALLGAVSHGPATRHAGNPGLFHYGVHATAILYALLGPGCEQVSTAYRDDAEVVTACWSDGRLATLHGLRRGSTAYGFVAFCEQGIVHQNVSARYAYRNLCAKIVESFTTGVPAVSHETSLEMVRFALAALESERRNGQWVSIKAVE
jgi:hypothetical protein